jgi:phage-related protein
MGNTEFIYNFAKINGKVEMIEFLESLYQKDQAKVKASMDKLIELLSSNNFPNEKLSKYLRDGIFELRVKLLNAVARNFYFFIKGNTIIFTHGFIKKTERTPSSEIEKAKFVKEYYKGKK